MPIAGLQLDADPQEADGEDAALTILIDLTPATDPVASTGSAKQPQITLSKDKSRDGEKFVDLLLFPDQRR